jgi:hypothetical protein|tara:strand:- start:742 stop:1146 length:405 start_codon:yes stop_codon:yes gene_type:complete
MGDDLDYQKELIRQQQDPSHDQSAFKVDVVCPFTGDEYVTTTPQYSYTFSGGTSDTVTIGTEDYSFAGDNLTYTIDGINEPAQEFVTHLPTMEKIEKMCEQYPGLKKAYEHFVFAYKLIRQDYDGKVKAGELDD